MRVLCIRDTQSLFVVNHQIGESVVTLRNVGIPLNTEPTVEANELAVARPKRGRDRQTSLQGFILDKLSHVSAHQDHNHRDHEEHDTAGEEHQLGS